MIEIDGVEREALTVGRLLSFIDGPHIETVCNLHWLRTLVNYIPSIY